MLIIFMDDSEEYRKLGEMTLRAMGHRVILAENGMEAVSALADHNVSAAILDVRGEFRPDEGLLAARIMTAMKPNLKVVLISSGDRPSGEFPFAPKPFDMAWVVKVLKEGIDMAGPNPLPREDR